MKNREEAMMIAQMIKVSGEIIAQGVVAKTGSLHASALILRSALAEIEFNIHMTGDRVDEYVVLRDALATTLEKALANGLAETNNKLTASGGSA